MLNWCFKVYFSLWLVLPVKAQNVAGWHWYKDPPASQEKSPKQKKACSQKDLSWSTQIKEMQKRHEEALAQAILNPSPEAVEHVLWMQKDMMDKAVRFQDLWQQVILQKGEVFLNPELNPNPLSQKIQDQDNRKALQEQLTRLSKKYGLFLALKQDCPYCTTFMPIVAEFARIYGFEVLGIGDISPRDVPFKVLKDNGVIKLINPEQKFPALFLVNLKHKEVWPLAWGLNALSDLERNAQVILKQMQQTRTS